MAAILLISMIILIIIFLVLILTTRMVLTASGRHGEIYFSLTVCGCGLLFHPGKSALGLICGKYRHLFRPGAGRRGADKPSLKKEEISRPKKAKSKIPLMIWIKIGRALILAAGRFMARINFDGSQLKTHPVMANPALAGMAYGWGQAFYGVFPGMRRTIDFAPVFDQTRGFWSGRLIVSIKNRQMVYIVYRLVRDLPIGKIIRHRFFKRGG